jgi:hypothetical protein
MFLRGNVHSIKGLPKQIWFERGIKGGELVGNEMHGPHPGLIISSNDYNESQNRGLVRLTLARDAGLSGRPQAVFLL